MTTATNFEAVRLQASGGGGVGTLAQVLLTGNDSGGTDVIVSSGDAIRGEDNAGGGGFSIDLFGGDAGAGVSTGGDVNVTPGLGFGGGDPGAINLNGTTNVSGDLNVTGSINLPLLMWGTGDPEGAVVADTGAIWGRTDGGAGNGVYVKYVNDGANTGWAPIGPLYCEEFTSIGVASFVTSRAVFSDPVGLGLCALNVFWNGLLQRLGGAEDYTVVYGGASATITFNVTPPSGDLITIQYLPE